MYHHCRERPSTLSCTVSPIQAVRAASGVLLCSVSSSSGACCLPAIRRILPCLQESSALCVRTDGRHWWRGKEANVHQNQNIF